jgi:hypothetical protein
MDARGRLWAGTGSVAPRLFTFLAQDPEARQEIPLPEPLETGFITRIQAGIATVRVTTDGHPDIFELDAKTRSWTGRSPAKGWVPAPSSTILQDDSTFMAEDGQLLALSAGSTMPVAQIADAVGARVHHTASGRLLTAPNTDGYSLSTLSASQPNGTTVQHVTLTPGAFDVQSFLAVPDGNLFIGGFKSEGLTAVDTDSDERWSSPDEVDLIHQIENMVCTDDGRLYLGTYSWADIIRCDTATLDDPASYSKVDRFSTTFHQSRPFGLTANSHSLFVGTVPDYGRSGGILARIDLESDSTDWVLDGDGEGFVPGHSIVGLTADEEYVYGTTSVRNGSGTEDAEGPAQVFKLEIASRRVVWQTTPVPDAGALYSPHLVAGWILIADLEGIAVIDPRDGSIAGKHRISSVENSSQRPGWAAADLAVIGQGEHVAHSAGGSIALASFASGTTSRMTADGADLTLGPRTASSPAGQLYAEANGRDIAQIAFQ